MGWGKKGEGCWVRKAVSCPSPAILPFISEGLRGSDFKISLVAEFYKPSMHPQTPVTCREAAHCQMCVPRCLLRTGFLGRSCCKGSLRESPSAEPSGTSVSPPCGSGCACFAPVAAASFSQGNRAGLSHQGQSSRSVARVALAGTTSGWLQDLPELQLLLSKDIPYSFQAWQIIKCEEPEPAGSQNITANIGQKSRRCHQGIQA